MTIQMNSPGGQADARFWHPFSDMAAVKGAELVISRAEGVWLWDDDGKRYLDGTASLWYANIGHGRKEMAEAIAEQIQKLDAYSTFADLANEPAIELSEKLASVAPVQDAKVFLTSGGGDSIDTAAKLARGYWVAAGQEDRVHIIGRTNGYHGTHGYGTSVAGIQANRVGWGPLMEGVSIVDHDSVEAMEAEIERIGPDRVAAFFVEPVIGAGGVYPPPDGPRGDYGSGRAIRSGGGPESRSRGAMHGALGRPDDVYRRART